MKEKLRKFDYVYSTFKQNICLREKCPVCGKKNFKLYLKYLYFKTLKCKNCNMIYISTVLDDKSLQNYYNNYVNFRIKNKLKLKQRKLMYEIDLNYLKLYKKKGKLIDIGCSNGNFLKLLSNVYNSYGIDIDTKAIELAKKNSKIKNKVFNLSLDKVGSKLGKFDIAVLRGVIEHVKDPKKYFSYISKILKKNGIIFICATPNVDSPAAIHFKANWNQYDPIQHINLFSSNTLSKLGKKFKLKLVGEHYPYINTPYENFKLDFENFLNKRGVSPPFWGSMMTLIYKKI